MQTQAQRQWLVECYCNDSECPAALPHLCGTALAIALLVAVIAASSTPKEAVPLAQLQGMRLGVEQSGIAHAREVYRRRAERAEKGSNGFHIARW